MKVFLRRLFGTLLIIAAIGGLIFSALGLIGVWRYRSTATESLLNTLEILNETLETTATGLVVTQESLEGAVASIRALQGTIQTTAKSVQSIEPMVGEIAKLMEEDIPNAVMTSQTSLKSAQESAKVIDGVLRTLSRIPFVGSSIEYDPETPLSEALGEVAASVDDLPNSFAEMQDSLEDSQHNLQILQVDFVLMIDAIRQIEASISQYESVIEGYQASLAGVQAQLDVIEANIPKAVEMTALALTIFLVWMAIAQIGLFTQGYEMLLQHEAIGATSETQSEE